MNILNQEKTDTITKISWNDFLEAFFIKKSIYKKLTPKAKEEHHFMLCRTLAKKDPIYINKLQEYKHWTIIDMLHRKYYNGKVIPNFVFLSNKQGKKIDVLKEFKENVIEYYLKINNIEIKSLKRLCELYPDDMKVELKEIDKILNSKIRKLKGQKVK
ncbi:hypothetical protein BPT24_161 [Tenacibaculum phage pT24]|uniref:Uncharacterized protein n=1 Tax=Tenacibaculum phage pT24 TaxID=1880590 RepID=A0A1B4XWW7_9CAUD|nr:hypothetical protein HYP10_gp161 [Tenacibaculum phage pT24]BAV39287.1 hypothetical protein BPT24_161 [Tenacibaculum phage pT24]